jgi:hypothetical protein
MSVRRTGTAAIMAVLVTTFAIAVAPSPAGANIGGYNLSVSSGAVVPAGQPQSNFALCNQGKPLGGGFRPDTGTRVLRMNEMYLLPGGGPGWTITVANEGPNQESFSVATICAHASLAYQVPAVTNQTVGPGQAATAQVGCGGGRRPFGGGVSAVSDNLRIVSSFRLPPSSSLPSGGWSVTMANEGTNSSTFDVYAVCDDPSASTTQVLTGGPHTVGAGQTLAVSRPCAPGKRPISGGIDSRSNDLRVAQTFFTGTVSNPTGWQAVVANRGTQSGFFLLKVLCEA